MPIPNEQERELAEEICGNALPSEKAARRIAEYRRALIQHFVKVRESYSERPFLEASHADVASDLREAVRKANEGL